MNATAKEMTVHEAMIAWDEAKEFLRPTIMRQRAEESFLRNVQAQVFSGMSSLWEVRDNEGSIVAYAVSFLYTPDGISITAQVNLAAANDMEPLVEHLDSFESWARKKGVHYLEVVGRKGWERVLRPFGFEFDHISLVKRITTGLH